MNKKLVVACGLDPGSGLRSPTGFAIIDPEKRELLHCQTFGSKHDLASHRIKEIADNFRKVIESVGLNYKAVVYCENFVMRGKGGETLARLTGALLAAIPYDVEMEFVHNITMKKLVGGNGKAEKLQVAEGCMKWLRDADAPIIQQFIDEENWDITDAIGLAIAGNMISEAADA